MDILRVTIYSLNSKISTKINGTTGYGISNRYEYFLFKKLLQHVLNNISHVADVKP